MESIDLGEYRGDDWGGFDFGQIPFTGRGGGGGGSAEGKWEPCGSGFTAFVQGGAAVVSGVGWVGNMGVLFTNNNRYGLPDIGVFIAHGPSAGINVGISATIGAVNGGINSLEGRTLNLDLGGSIFAGSASFTPTGSPKGTMSFGSFSGASAGFAAGFPVTIGLSSTKTSAGGLMEDIIVPAINAAYSKITNVPFIEKCDAAYQAYN